MTLSTDLDDGRPWVRRIVTLAILLGVVGGGAYAAYYFGFRDDTPAAAVATTTDATVTKGQLLSSFTTNGTAASTLTTKLTFQASGQVKTISVAVGDKVTAGQELGRLDDRDASRKLESSRSSLVVAQIKLQQLMEPPKAADVASAQQSVSSALGQVASAQAQIASTQANVVKATAGPADADVLTANAAVSSAEIALTTSNNQIDSTWTGLLGAQRNYCVLPAILVDVCYSQDIPLADLKIASLNAELRNPPGSASQGNAIASAVTSLFSANTAYLNAKNAIVTAQNNIDTAKAKRTALYAAISASDLAQLQASVTTAQAGLVTAQAGLLTAQAKLDQVNAGTTAADIALQSESVKQSQISLQQQQDAYDALVLRAPYAGAVGAVAINVGDQVGASTAAITLTNPDGVRIDLTVSETDLSSLKPGQYGVATFDALASNFYLLKITGVSTTPTVTQGIVTYPVQAQILRGPDLAANAAGLQQISSVLTTAGGSARTVPANVAGGGGAAGGFQGAAGAGAAGAQGGAQRTPAANRTPGAAAAGRTPGAGGGAGLLAQIANAPLPSPGMTASVTVVLSVTDDALLLPTTAIKRSGRTSVVNLKLPDGTLEQRTVTTGGTDSTSTAILTGLVEGDVVQIGTTAVASAATASRTAAPAGGRQPTPAGGVR
ncbi:MAG: HlyD family efflux transporter periplasmic adaptor subunit [Tepidiformaceae bacterium]